MLQFAFLRGDCASEPCAFTFVKAPCSTVQFAFLREDVANEPGVFTSL